MVRVGERRGQGVTDVDTEHEPMKGMIMTETTEPTIEPRRRSDRLPGTTLDALPTNMRAGRSATVTVCAEPDAAPYGRPCRVLVGPLVTGPPGRTTVVDEGGTCPRHGRPSNPQRVTVHSAWDTEGNRTMTHPMWH